MYNKAKRYSIPAYKEAKGMRGELIRKVVNYLPHKKYRKV